MRSVGPSFSFSSSHFSPSESSLTCARARSRVSHKIARSLLHAGGHYQIHFAYLLPNGIHVGGCCVNSSSSLPTAPRSSSFFASSSCLSPQGPEPRSDIRVVVLFFLICPAGRIRVPSNRASLSSSLSVLSFRVDLSSLGRCDDRWLGYSVQHFRPSFHGTDHHLRSEQKRALRLSSHVPARAHIHLTAALYRIYPVSSLCIYIVRLLARERSRWAAVPVAIAGRTTARQVKTRARNTSAHRARDAQVHSAAAAWPLAAVWVGGPTLSRRWTPRAPSLLGRARLDAGVYIGIWWWAEVRAVPIYRVGTTLVMCVADSAMRVRWRKREESVCEYRRDCYIFISSPGTEDLKRSWSGTLIVVATLIRILLQNVMEDYLLNAY